MKPLILIALVYACSAADYVELTLKDGRVLVGEYDAYSEILDLGQGKITVKQSQVAKCNAAERPAAKVAPPASAAAPAAPTKDEDDADKALASLAAADALYMASVKRVAETALLKAKRAQAQMPAAITLSDTMTVAQHKEAKRQNERRARLDYAVERLEAMVKPHESFRPTGLPIVYAAKCAVECKTIMKELDR